MSSPRTSDDSNNTTDAAPFDPDALDDTALQQLIGKVLTIYVARRHDGHEFPPFAGEQLTATEVVMVATELLEAGGSACALGGAPVRGCFQAPGGTDHDQDNVWMFERRQS